MDNKAQGQSDIDRYINLIRGIGARRTVDPQQPNNVAPMIRRKAIVYDDREQTPTNLMRRGEGSDDVGLNNHCTWLEQYGRNARNLGDALQSSFTGCGLDFVCQVCNETLRLDVQRALPTHLTSKPHWAKVVGKLSFRVDKSMEACQYHIGCNVVVPGRTDVTLHINVYAAWSKVEGRQEMFKRLENGRGTSRRNRPESPAAELQNEL